MRVTIFDQDHEREVEGIIRLFGHMYPDYAETELYVNPPDWIEEPWVIGAEIVVSSSAGEIQINGQVRKIERFEKKVVIESD